jgi:hypothetical protein
MSIYHQNLKHISRGKGQSACAAAAYRSGTKIYDERLGQTHNYEKKQGVDYTKILAPSYAPSWVNHRAQLWNQVEKKDTRINARPASELDIALPIELSQQQQIKLIKTFAQTTLVSRGLIVDLACHDLNSHNPHAHLMFTTRKINEQGLGEKDRDIKSKDFLNYLRQTWEEQANDALSQAKIPERIDHRSLEAQGIVDREPQIHLGPDICQMRARGISTDRGEKYDEIEQTNANLAQLYKELETIEQQIQKEEEERQREEAERQREEQQRRQREEAERQREEAERQQEEQQRRQREEAERQQKEEEERQREEAERQREEQQRRQREEAERQREEAERQREEAERQREEQQRRQREEAERQREEQQRRQREEEKKAQRAQAQQFNRLDELDPKRDTRFKWDHLSIPDSRKLNQCIKIYDKFRKILDDEEIANSILRLDSEISLRFLIHHKNKNEHWLVTKTDQDFYLTQLDYQGQNSQGLPKKLHLSLNEHQNPIVREYNIGLREYKKLYNTIPNILQNRLDNHKAKQRQEQKKAKAQEQKQLNRLYRQIKQVHQQKTSSETLYLSKSTNQQLSKVFSPNHSQAEYIVTQEFRGYAIKELHPRARKVSPETPEDHAVEKLYLTPNYYKSSLSQNQREKLLQINWQSDQEERQRQEQQRIHQQHEEERKKQSQPQRSRKPKPKKKKRQHGQDFQM